MGLCCPICLQGWPSEGFLGRAGARGYPYSYDKVWSCCRPRREEGVLEPLTAHVRVGGGTVPGDLTLLQPTGSFPSGVIAKSPRCVMAGPHVIMV